jgi:hypothetical protein
MYFYSMAKKQNDINQLAKSIVDRATGNEDSKVEDTNNADAVALRHLGRQKGGKARAKSLTAEQRSEIAKKASARRWDK